MKTLQEFKEFCKVEIAPAVRFLEKERERLVKKIIAIGIIAVVVAGIFISIFASRVREPVSFVIFPLIAAGSVTLGLGWYISKGYRGDFKYLIIEKLVRFIDPGLKYNAKGCIEELRFNASKIFLTNPNRYKGNDLVWGKVGQTVMKFSEVDAAYESGGKNRSRRQIFKGLFFTADFNKSFYGRTVVLPDTSENLFGKMGQMLQQWNISRDDLVRLEDPEFEKEFVVYSTDQVEARYILSTSLMKRIVDFKRKSRRKIYLSFITPCINIAISCDRNLFEPRLFSTLLDFGPIQKYFEDLSLAVGIIEDLNLNTRIWTKT